MHLDISNMHNTSPTRKNCRPQMSTALRSHTLLYQLRLQPKTAIEETDPWLQTATTFKVTAVPQVTAEKLAPRSLGPGEREELQSRGCHSLSSEGFTRGQMRGSLPP